MKIETTRFGTLEIDDSSIIRMPKGPLGFEEQKDYCILQHRPDTNFRWLQSIDEPGLAFVVVDPSQFYADYDIDVPDAETEMLNLKNADDALVLAVVTIADEGKDITVNLAAPIVINSRDLTGMQVVLQDGRYSVKHTLGQEANRNAAGDARAEELKTEVKAA